MDFLTTGARIKYYRSLLHITQKELAMGKLSKSMIYNLECNKRRLTPVTASILVSNFNEIAHIKGFEFNLTIKDFLMPDEEYADVLCRKWIMEDEEGFVDEDKYLKVIELAKKYNLHEHVVKAYEKLYFHYYNQRKYSQALTYIEASLTSANLLDNPEIKINVFTRNGTCNYMLLNYGNALFYYKQAYGEFLKYRLQNQNLENKLLYNLALVSLELKNYSDTEMYLGKLLSLTDIDDSSFYENLIIKANLYLALDKLHEALELYKEILNHDIKYLYTIENNMGLVFMRLGKLDESIEIYTKSISRQLNSLTPTTTLALRNIALVFYKKKRYKEAINFYEWALNNAVKFKQLDRIIQCYENLYNICIDMDNINQFDIYYKSMLELFKNNELNENQLDRLYTIKQDYTENLKISHKRR